MGHCCPVSSVTYADPAKVTGFLARFIACFRGVQIIQPKQRNLWRNYTATATEDGASIAVMVVVAVVVITTAVTIPYHLTTY